MSFTSRSCWTTASTLSLLLAFSSVADSRPVPLPLGTGLWSINIDESPAPSPQDGPPQDVNAVRNPALLGPEVAAVFGSYLVVVIFVCIGILTVGRRLRRSRQGSSASLGMEMLSPVKTKPSSTNPWGPSPISPLKSNVWPSPKPRSGWGSLRGKHSYQDSIQSSVITFDESVVEEDRTKAEMEMDRLYAAVAEHEAQREKSKSQHSVASDEVPLSPSLPSLPMSPKLPKAHTPPELQHLRYGPVSPRRNHQFPLSPPPDPSDEHPSRTPSGGPSPVEGPNASARRLNRPSPIDIANPPSRGSSFTSLKSFGKRRGTSIRGLPISPPLPMSPPMGSPDFAPHDQQRYSEREPLTPRYAPPTPRQEVLASPQPGDTERRFHFAPSIRSSRSSVHSFNSPSQTPRTATFPVAPPPAIKEESRSNSSADDHNDNSDGAGAGERGGKTITTGGFNFTIDPPAASLHSSSGSGSSTPKTGASTPKAQRSKPAPLAITTTHGSSLGSLPLRTAPLPLRDLRSPTSARPPSTIRVTELTRPEIKRSLRTPNTAVPATPYSPYMPQTPLTPMTPSRLVTREERRRKKKEEGRRVLTADDVVAEESELFGDAY